MVIICSTTEGLRGAESNEVTFALKEIIGYNV